MTSTPRNSAQRNSLHRSAISRRALTATAGLALLGLAAAGCSGDSPLASDDQPHAADPASSSAHPGQDGASRTGSSSTESSTPEPPPPPELPLGGRTLLPDYQLVGFCGTPGASALGPLHATDLGPAAQRLDEQIAGYRDAMSKQQATLGAPRKVQPVFELIGTVTTASPGTDGKYRNRVAPEVVDRYLAAAREHNALLLINIQPGRADFMPEVQAYQRWLTQPDVGLALDPEWAIGPGERPGETYGSTTGTELDSVAGYLSQIVQQNNLPEKAMVFHQVASSVVRGQEAITDHPGVAAIKSVDGIGSQSLKTGTWKTLTKSLPESLHTGFKLFFQEDREHGELMTPEQVLALRPRPGYVMYE